MKDLQWVIEILERLNAKLNEDTETSIKSLEEEFPGQKFDSTDVYPYKVARASGTIGFILEEVNRNE